MNTTTMNAATDWMRVCPLEEIPALGARVLETQQHGAIAIFRNSTDEVFALRDQCPHQGGPLSAGIVHGRSVTCPLHNWRIEFDNGQACEPDEGCTAVFPVKVEQGEIFIRL